MVRIYGRGVAALTCAKLLFGNTLDVEICGERQPSNLIVLLSRSTLDLLSELFEAPDLCQHGYPVWRRIVHWQDGAQTEVRDSPARSIALDELVTQLEALVDNVPMQKVTTPNSRVRWQIDATGRGSHIARRLADVHTTTFGNRHVIAAESAWTSSTSEAIMERTEQGWFFVFPAARDRAIVQFMYPLNPASPVTILKDALPQAPIVSNSISLADIVFRGCYRAAPRILSPIGSDSWLAVGDAAFSFDPICGDGIGASVHSAILAAALLQISDGHKLNAAIDHYHKRLQRSFAIHLKLINQYYEPLSRSPLWSDELRSTQQFLNSVSAKRILEASDFRYRLSGKKLVAISKENYEE